MLAVISIRPIKFRHESIASRQAGTANQRGLILFFSWFSRATGSFASLILSARNKNVSPKNRKKFRRIGCLNSTNTRLLVVPSAETTSEPTYWLSISLAKMVSRHPESTIANMMKRMNIRLPFLGAEA